MTLLGDAVDKNRTHLLSCVVLCCLVLSCVVLPYHSADVGRSLISLTVLRRFRRDLGGVRSFFTIGLGLGLGLVLGFGV
jgi:hypothetical protein